MKVEIHRPAEWKFGHLARGEVFLVNLTAFMKIEPSLRIDDHDNQFNAIALNSGSLAYFPDHEVIGRGIAKLIKVEF